MASHTVSSPMIPPRPVPWFGQGISFNDDFTSCELNCPDRLDVNVLLNHIDTLKTVDLRRSEFFPAEILELSNLEYLNIAYCPLLKDIPDEIGRLTNLKTLLINKVGITTIPDTILGCESLECINVVFCTELTTFPETIQLLPKLEFLQIYPLSHMDISTDIVSILDFDKMGLAGNILVENWREILPENKAKQLDLELQLKEELSLLDPHNLNPSNIPPSHQLSIDKI